MTLVNIVWLDERWPAVVWVDAPNWLYKKSSVPWPSAYQETLNFKKADISVKQQMQYVFPIAISICVSTLRTSHFLVMCISRGVNLVPNKDSTLLSCVKSIHFNDAKSVTAVEIGSYLASSWKVRWRARIRYWTEKKLRKKRRGKGKRLERKENREWQRWCRERKRQREDRVVTSEGQQSLHIIQLSWKISSPLYGQRCQQQEAL